MFVRKRAWKAAALVALICTGVVVAVVGVKIHKYHVVGKHPEAGCLLLSEDGRTMTDVNEIHADSPEQAVEYAEEIDLLRQHGKRELVSVVEKEVNGKLSSRMFRFKYVLTDGREITRGDPDPDYLEDFLTEADQEELISLLRADEYEKIGLEEKEVRGRMFSFARNRFVLSDGTEVIWSRGIRKNEQ
ncbi:MAG TPA: hypothetical protein VMW91_08875 [Desulfosporosinus sp.]|nr:hypothetical protein [Desulfosporosinus sp.]